MRLATAIHPRLPDNSGSENASPNANRLSAIPAKLTSKSGRRPTRSISCTVHREGKKTEILLGGSHQTLDQRAVHQACEELGLDPSQLPGPQSRV
jgi:hypothetical protein